MANLYIAGSSVFPTAGANYPTFTLVALAMRLSDHITQELRSGSVDVTRASSMPSKRVDQVVLETPISHATAALAEQESGEDGVTTRPEHGAAFKA